MTSIRKQFYGKLWNHKNPSSEIRSVTSQVRELSEALSLSKPLIYHLTMHTGKPGWRSLNVMLMDIIWSADSWYYLGNC